MSLAMEIDQARIHALDVQPVCLKPSLTFSPTIRIQSSKKGGFTMSPLSGRKADLNYGFTLVELIVILSILAIISSIAIPAYSSLLPDYKLKNAARDLYSAMRLAKILAIKQNATYQIEFDITGKGSYKIVRPDGTIERTVFFSTYDPSGGICYGGGKATKSASESGGPLPIDGVSYSGNKINFYPKGTTGLGYVYLENRKGAAYSIGTWISGIVILKKWRENNQRWVK